MEPDRRRPVAPVCGARARRISRIGGYAVLPSPAYPEILSISTFAKRWYAGVFSRGYCHGRTARKGGTLRNRSADRGSGARPLGRVCRGARDRRTSFIRLDGVDDQFSPDKCIEYGTEIAPSADIEFIAAARNYMPRLLAELRRRRSQPL